MINDIRHFELSVAEASLEAAIAMAVTSKGGDACQLPLSCQFWRSCLTPFQRCNKYGRNFESDIYYKNQLARYIMIFSNY